MNTSVTNEIDALQDAAVAFAEIPVFFFDDI